MLQEWHHRISSFIEQFFDGVIGIYRHSQPRTTNGSILVGVTRKISARDFNVGDTIWIDVQGRSKGELPRDKSILLRLKNELDRLSDELKVPRLSQFFDYSELKAAYADVGEQQESDDSNAEFVKREQSGEVWFDPAPALAAVRMIRDHLIRHPESLTFSPDPKRRHWSATLSVELNDCQSALEAAVSQGRHFRFLVVP